MIMQQTEWKWLLSSRSKAFFCRCVILVMSGLSSFYRQGSSRLTQLGFVSRRLYEQLSHGLMFPLMEEKHLSGTGHFGSLFSPPSRFRGRRKRLECFASFKTERLEKRAHSVPNSNTQQMLNYLLHYRAALFSARNCLCFLFWLSLLFWIKWGGGWSQLGWSLP